MKRIKNFLLMRSLFAKTWLISVISIFLTTGLLFLLVSMLANSVIYDKQKEKFDKESQTIISLVKEQKNQELDQYIEQGYTIQINDISMHQTEDFSNDTTVASEGSMTVQINTNMLMDSKKKFKKEIEIKNKGKLTNVQIYFPIALGQSEIVDVTTTIAPYFFFITFIVSGIVAVGYATYFSTKIKRINTIVDEMSVGNYPIEVENKVGDELQELRQHIQAMYCKLRKTMDALQEEIQLVKNLEDSRQLFISGIVHELKTPIMNLTLSLKNIYFEEVSEEKKIIFSGQLDYLKGMNRLVSELLDLSRIDQKETDEQQAIVPILDEVIDVYKEMLEDNEQQIQIDMPCTVMMAIPINKMQKLFSNLIGNAIKYAPKKSSIKIVGSNESIEISNEIRKDLEELSIADIHKPFVTTDKETDYISHGLGLYLVQSILQFYDYSYCCVRKKGEFSYQIFLKE